VLRPRSADVVLIKIAARRPGDLPLKDWAHSDAGRRWSTCASWKPGIWRRARSSMSLLRGWMRSSRANEIREEFCSAGNEERARHAGQRRAYDVSHSRRHPGHRRKSTWAAIILDMPEPWDVWRTPNKRCAPGAYSSHTALGTINQTQLLRETLRKHSFGLEEDRRDLCAVPGTSVTGRSVRPDHRMVAHNWISHVGPTARRASRRGCLVLSNEMHSPGHSSAGLDDGVFHARGHDGQPFGAAGVLKTSSPAYVGQAVIEQREDRGAYFFAQTVAGTEVLVQSKPSCPPPWLL